MRRFWVVGKPGVIQIETCRSVLISRLFDPNFRVARDPELELTCSAPSAPVVPGSRTTRARCHVAIMAWCEPQKPNEGAPHYVDVTESSGCGNLLKAFLRAFELAPCCLDSHLKHILRRRRAHLSRKNALKVPHAHRHAIGKVAHQEFRLKMLHNPDLELAN